MKLKKIFILFLLIFSLGVNTVYASQKFEIAEEYQVCHDGGVLKAMKVIAVVIVAIKVLIPVFLIITGIKSLTGAVLDQDDGQIKKAAQLFIVKFIIGAFVFFIPTIIYSIMEAAHGYDKSVSQFTDCGKCLTSIKTCDQLIKKYS